MTESTDAQSRVEAERVRMEGIRLDETQHTPLAEAPPTAAPSTTPFGLDIPQQRSEQQICWHLPTPLPVQQHITKFVDGLRNHPDRPALLCQNSSQSRDKYQKTKSPIYLSFAVELGYIATTSVPVDDPRHSWFLHNYARALQCIWEETMKLHDLEKTLEYYKLALNRSREDDAARSIYLSDVGYILQNKFRQSRSLQDLRDARRYFEQAAQDQDLSNRPLYRNNIARSLQTEFEFTKDRTLLEEAIVIQEEIVKSLQSKTPILKTRLFYRNLGTMLTHRFRETHAIDDIDRAIHNLSNAVDPTQHDATFYGELAKAFAARFDVFQSVTDADEAIKHFRVAHKAFPNDITLINQYANTIWNRANRIGENIGEFDEAIELLRKTLQVTPEPFPQSTVVLNSLARALYSKFLRTGALECLDESIDLFNSATADSEHSERPMMLGYLSEALLFRFEHTEVWEDLMRSAEMSKLALASVSSAKTKSASIIDRLAKSFKVKFQRTNSMKDLDTSIQYYESIISLPPSDHDIPLYLNNYANALQLKSAVTGSKEFLNSAIELQEKAFSLTPVDHPDRLMYLTGLANSLLIGYQLTGSLNDLRASIINFKTVVDATPEDHRNLAGRLHNLGLALLDRFKELKVVQDLNDAISNLESAVDTAQASHRRAISSFSNTLGIAWYRSFEQSQSEVDLNQAILYFERAREATEDDALKSLILSNLGAARGQKADMTREPQDLIESIRIRKDAFHATPQGDVAKGDRLFNFGAACHKLYLDDATKTAEGRAAIYAYEGVVSEVECVRPSTRISAAIAAAELRETVDADVNKACDLLQLAVELLSESVALDLDLADQMHTLPKYYQLAANATSLTLVTGRPADRALRLFELGRGVMLNQLLNNRTDLADLVEQHAEIAKRFLNAKDFLYPPVQTERRNLETSSDLVRVRRRYVMNNYANVLTEIRSLQGFKALFEPPGSQQLHCLRIEGPVIAVNVHRRRCDAIVITSNGVTSFELPKLKFDDAVQQMATIFYALDLQRKNEAEAQKVFEYTLKWLWECVAEPILESVGIQDAPQLGKPWPRIWWISGGIFSLLPIHAAGDHQRRRDTGEPCTVIDRVVSSYSPTLKSLVHAFRRNKAIDSALNDSELRGLIIGMKNTLDQDRLDGVPEEVRKIKSRLSSSIAIDEVMHPNRVEALSLLKGCTMAHFACHAVTDRKDPSRSRLLLKDWKQRPLNFRELSKIRLERCRLVYLSACSTAENKNIHLVDESIHLAGGFQLTGVPSVIGTLWKVYDNESTFVADAFYESWLEGNSTLDTRRSALALHQAVRKLRDKPGNANMPLNWAAYIHYGV